MNRWITVLPIAWLVLSGCEPGTRPSGGEPAVSPEVAAKLFANHCAICHGENGDGHGPRRPSLYRKPPDFRDESWRSARTVAQVEEVIRDGVPGSDMPSWKRLGDPAVAGLAQYVLDLGAGRP
jgi:high-affinity iron transporter